MAIKLQKYDYSKLEARKSTRTAAGDSPWARGHGDFGPLEEVEAPVLLHVVPQGDGVDHGMYPGWAEDVGGLRGEESREASVHAGQLRLCERRKASIHESRNLKEK